MSKEEEISSNLVGRWFCRGHVFVRICPVPGETAETAGETCDWAPIVASRSLWTTSSSLRFLLFPLGWQRHRSKVDRQVPTAWRPTSATETRSAFVWSSFATTARHILNHIVNRTKTRLNPFARSWFYNATAVRGALWWLRQSHSVNYANHQHSPFDRRWLTFARRRHDVANSIFPGIVW